MEETTRVAKAPRRAAMRELRNAFGGDALSSSPSSPSGKYEQSNKDGLVAYVRREIIETPDSSKDNKNTEGRKSE